MLNKDEEKRLASLTNVFQVQKDDGKGWGHPMLISDLLWLAEKLKEVNEELKALIKEEVKDCNCAGISHVNECPKWVLPY